MPSDEVSPPTSESYRSPVDVIQRILRHADIGTTREHYAKTLPPAVRKSMSKLDRRLKRDKNWMKKGWQRKH